MPTRRLVLAFLAAVIPLTSCGGSATSDGSSATVPTTEATTTTTLPPTADDCRSATPPATLVGAECIDLQTRAIELGVAGPDELAEILDIDPFTDDPDIERCALDGLLGSVPLERVAEILGSKTGRWSWSSLLVEKEERDAAIDAVIGCGDVRARIGAALDEGEEPVIGSCAASRATGDQLLAIVREAMRTSFFGEQEGVRSHYDDCIDEAWQERFKGTPDDLVRLTAAHPYGALVAGAATISTGGFTGRWGPLCANGLAQQQLGGGLALRLLGAASIDDLSEDDRSVVEGFLDELGEECFPNASRMADGLLQPVLADCVSGVFAGSEWALLITGDPDTVEWAEGYTGAIRGVTECVAAPKE